MLAQCFLRQFECFYHSKTWRKARFFLIRLSVPWSSSDWLLIYTWTHTYFILKLPCISIQNPIHFHLSHLSEGRLVTIKPMLLAKEASYFKNFAPIHKATIIFETRTTMHYKMEGSANQETQSFYHWLSTFKFLDLFVLLAFRQEFDLD